MPATAGRVRMPHNNRMSTSATLKTHAIWQTAIGHDPYANEEEKQESNVTEADKEKARSVMEMARNQNVTDGAKRDDFTAKMFAGLKRTKQRRQGDAQQSEAVNPELQQILDAPSSSSEDEYVQVKEKKRKKAYPSDDDSSSDESPDRRDRRRRKEKRKRRKHRRRYSSDESNSSDDERRRKRKHKRRKSRDDRKSRKRDSRR